jgi:hypothetical protein
VNVAAARDVARRWVGAHAAGAADFAGAFLSGSVIWLPDAAELPPTSDVDVMVVTTSAEPPPKLGKFLWEGVLLEVTSLSWARLRSAEMILGSYHLAGSFRRNTIVADPTGRLAELLAATAPEYARLPWVRRRCEDALQRITGGLEAFDHSAPWHRQVTAWLFPTGVTTHVLLTAGLRNPTVRLRYPAVRELVVAYGQREFYEELLALLRCAGMTRNRVEHHLAVMTAVFDATVPVARTPVPFSADITAAGRPVAVEGGRRLIADGLHREAVFWMVATYARCLTILTADAPATARRFASGFDDLLGDLGITSVTLPGRVREVLDHLPRLWNVTEAVLAANPDIRA